MRDDFAKQTIDILAKRVNYRCSNPNCRKPTSGPREDPTKAVNIGVAAHITAASEGGPRYDPSLTSEQRKHPDNGIWLCQNCAKLVDNDAARYPAELLRQWKEQAEQTARDDIEHGFVQKIVQVFTGPPPQVERGLEIQVPRTGLGALFGRKERTITLTPAQQRRERENLLSNVQATWIDGYLHHAVHNAVYMELGIEYQRDAVSRPWDLTLQPTNEPIPRAKPIGELFAEHGRSLLILGDPASGKTITLLQLAEELLAQAQQDATCPIPVVLNLSSWARERGALVDWLVEEMSTMYQVSRDLTRAWLQVGQLALLLDGLDEVEEASRDDCIAAINDFNAEHLADIVVCSRTADYEKPGNRLNLSTAIHIQPLTLARIDAYLGQFGSSLDGVRVALGHDRDLQELAQSPLILSLMPLTFGGLKEVQIPTGLSLDLKRRDFLTAYVRRAFQHRPLPPDSPYDQPQALCWLTNLARGMARHEQTIFYMERLQPTWLSTDRARRRYRWSVRLIGGLISGLISGLIVGLIVGLVNGPVNGMSVGLSFGLSVGLVGGLFVGLSENITSSEELRWSRPSVHALLKEVRGGLSGGLILGMVGGLFFGLFFGLIVGLSVGLIVGLSGGLMGGLIACIQTSQTQQQTRPNQGIYGSLRNALRMGFLYALIFGLGGGLGGGLVYGPSGRLPFGLSGGLTLGLSGGLILGLIKYGGEAVTQHYTLRLWLARQGILPFPLRDSLLIAYLDAMVDRILLRRVGGGWVFIHRYLLEYFASLETGSQDGD